MQIKPNRTMMQATIKEIVPDPDGFGANLEVLVERSEAAPGFEDFIGAQPGATLTIFAPDIALIELGDSYALTTSLLGGPDGERVVLERAEKVGG